MAKLLQKFPYIKNSDELFKMFKKYNGDVVEYMKKSHDPSMVDYYIRYAAEMAIEEIDDRRLEPDPFTTINERIKK